jgi:hypothetical protein
MLVLLVFVVGSVACSGDDDESPPAAEGTTASLDTTTTAAPERAPLRVVALNQLHGLFCPEETDFCGAPARLGLLFEAIEAADCPDVVGLAEIGPRQTVLVPERLPTLCDGKYTLLYDGEAQAETVDQEMILTALDVIDDGYVELSNIPWSGHWAQLDSELGPLDVVMLHQASSANNPVCTPEICAPICPAGEETGTCHTREVLAFLDEHAAPDGIQLVTGDLNRPIDDPRIQTYLDAGFEDTWLLAGNAECDPATGEGCTCCISGGDAEDYDGGGLRNPAGSRDERIDFVLVRNAIACDLQARAEVFAGEAAAEPADGYLWPSDHAGVLAELRCG